MFALLVQNITYRFLTWCKHADGLIPQKVWSKNVFSGGDFDRLNDVQCQLRWHCTSFNLSKSPPENTFLDQTFGKDRITKQSQFISEPNLINLSSFGVDIREKNSLKYTHIKSTNSLNVLCINTAMHLHKYCKNFALFLQNKFVVLVQPMISSVRMDKDSLQRN